MKPNEIPDIDELLNSYIDGELDARHKTQVKRLMKNDKKIAERLQELKNCRMLVSSLPYTEAPPELLGNIKTALEENKLPVQPIIERRQQVKLDGTKHLLFRRLTAAAAMVALVGVLAAVIYSILAPETPITRPVYVEQPTAVQPIEVAVAEKPLEAAVPAEEFTGRLELKTSSPSEALAFINKSIELNIPADEQAATATDRPRKSFTLFCSRQNLRSLLADIGTIWDKFDSATLFIDTDEGQIVIGAVAPEQIVEIAKQDDVETRIKAAKYFAVMNNMTELSPGKEVLAAAESGSPRLITIPKPVLTSSEKPVTKTADGTEAEQKVVLTIVVTGSE